MAFDTNTVSIPQNQELQALLPFLRGIELEGIDSFEESIPGDESIPLWNRFL